MTEVNISSLWTVSSVIFGFQLTALAWRINRETQMEMRCEITWLTIADGFVFLSVLVLIAGVFVGPILGIINNGTAAKLFGLSLIIFASTPLILAGHYNLFYKDESPRPQVTKQEGWALLVSSLAISFYTVGWWLF